MANAEVLEPIQNWNCQQLATYLRSKGHPEPYIQALTQEQEIDGKSLLLLSEDDLKAPSIGIKVRHSYVVLCKQ